ncbi:hypothetical protein WDV13_06035 [Weissella cibaria]|uniref:hypothetical protein n=1 Tax=Weissella cibaria TaxID=137591 RepID=UPI00211E1414|nr:hypothetical protein [Weissella cibaria]MCQ9619920.1 hypothetical protein [Weissella cibaria]
MFTSVTLVSAGGDLVPIDTKMALWLLIAGALFPIYLASLILKKSTHMQRHKERTQRG